MDPLSFKDNAAKLAFADALAKFVDHCIEMREAYAAMAKPARKVYTAKDIKETLTTRDPYGTDNIVRAKTHDGRIVEVSAEALPPFFTSDAMLRALVDKLNAEPS